MTTTPTPTIATPTAAIPTAARRVRRAWRIGGSIVTAALLASFTASGIDQLALRTETRRSSVEASGVRHLVVHADSTDVAVSGTAERSEIDATATVRRAFLRPTFSVRKVGSTVHVTALCAETSPSCVQRLRLNVPSDVAVDITLETGDVAVAAIESPVDVEVSTGNVRLVDVSGTTDITTETGDIRISDATSATMTVGSETGDVEIDAATSPFAAAATTETGDVTIELPAADDRAGIDFAVTAESQDGTVSTRIRTNPTSERTIIATTESGDVSLAYRG